MPVSLLRLKKALGRTGGYGSFGSANAKGEREGREGENAAARKNNADCRAIITSAGTNSVPTYQKLDFSLFLFYRTRLAVASASLEAP
jgi:hypothetical protein